jgi:hypothetical protein
LWWPAPAWPRSARWTGFRVWRQAIAAAALAYLLYKSFVPLPPFPTSVFVYVLFGTLVLSVLAFPLVSSRRTGLRQLGSSVTEYDVDEGSREN